MNDILFLVVRIWRIYDHILHKTACSNLHDVFHVYALISTMQEECHYVSTCPIPGGIHNGEKIIFFSSQIS